MNKYIFSTLLIIMLVSLPLRAQTVQGTVEDVKQQRLVGATVLELGTQNGVVTDVNGEFLLEMLNRQSKLLIAYSGFITDTVAVDHSDVLHIVLHEDAKSLDEVVINASSTFVDHLKSRHVEIITEAELTKAACCNLSESFETNASIDVSFTDAISGAKIIRMLGLDGRYIQINRENIPNVRGLSGRYGLSYVPGTWVQSIDVGKGAGTVVNGYESMTGQINVELKKPKTSEKLYINSYANSFGRLELNAHHGHAINNRWNTSIFLHSNYFNNEIDRNKDGFMDLPKSKQINVMNQYQFEGEKMHSKFGVNVMRDEKVGGQLGFGYEDDFRTSPQYGFANRTTRLEVFGKTGLLFPARPYRGWGFIYSASYLDIEGGFGRHPYKGKETTLYGNIIFQNIIGSSFHEYKTGASIIYDDFDETYSGVAYTRREIVPGLYYEYTFSPGAFTLIAGGRTDFHNLYGTYFTPRLHTRYQFTDEITLRASIGRGYRTPNAIVENSNALLSSRRLVIEEEPRPEVSWNMGTSLVVAVPIGDKKLNLVADYFYTVFENQLIYDLDRNSEALHVYNLRGRSFAHSFQLEGNYRFTDRLSFKTAYKFYNVRATINNKLREVPFNARNRFFLNGSYATKYDQWKIDATLQWFGTKRLPDTMDKQVEFQRPPASPDFFLLQMQVSRGFRWGNVYAGSENLLGFTQENPVIDPDNPFGDAFDASIIWAPVAGRIVYFGFKYKIK